MPAARTLAGFRPINVLWHATSAGLLAVSWVAQLNLGTALDDAGRTEEALPHLQRAVALQPAAPETRFTLGHVLWAAGRRAEAVGQFEETLRLDPNHAGARAILDGLRSTGLTTP